MAVSEKQAKERIPKQYWDYLVMIHDRPYLQVDGRTAMVTDEQRGSKEPLSVEFKSQWTLEAEGILATYGDGSAGEALIAQLKPELKDILTCIVEIGNRRAEGSAKINWGGPGVDKTNPYENAQTSAYGRALGMLGYGLLGTGIASAEEVKAAIAEQEKIAKAEAKPSGMPAPRPAPPTPTEAGLGQPDKDPGAIPPPVAEIPPPAGKPSDTGEDAALTQAEGPCADCGQPLAPAISKWVASERKRGKAARWSHAAVKGWGCKQAAKQVAKTAS